MHRLLLSVCVTGGCKVNNFDYDATLPELCHQYLEKGKDMAPQAMENLTTLANSVVLDKTHVTDMGVFVNNYLDVFNRGFQYAFMAAIGAMIISLIIYMANKKRFPDPATKAKTDKGATTVNKEEIRMSATEMKTAYLCPVCCIRCCYFLLVIFPSEWLFFDLFCP